uniref:Uncharacterized protein n=1 Tax=Anguilla anguilla TaxID=7936 RepID=A0A0E9VXW5_ANGAN
MFCTIYTRKLNVSSKSKNSSKFFLKWSHQKKYVTQSS